MSSETFDELRRVSRRLNKFRLKMYGGKEPRVCEVPEVEGLSYPRWLPDETPPVAVEPSADSVLGYYTPGGELIRGTMREQLATYYRYRELPGHHVVSRSFFRAGCPIWVSTVYLGLNLNYGPRWEGPALVWETMVFAGDYSGEAQWRFATGRAALAAHRDVVWRIASGQRLRRSVAPVTPPRRGRMPRLRVV